MEMGIMQGIGTVLVMIAFLGIFWWAFSKHKKKDFEEASRLPFDEDELQDSDGESGQDRNKRQE